MMYRTRFEDRSRHRPLTASLFFYRVLTAIGSTTRDQPVRGAIRSLSGVVLPSQQYVVGRSMAFNDVLSICGLFS